MKRFEYLTTEEARDRVNRYTRGTTWHNKKDQVRVLAMDKDRTLYHMFEHYEIKQVNDPKILGYH